MIQQLRVHHAQGGKILAECGGMMYLGKAILDEQGRSHTLCGILDLVTGIEHKQLSLGYRRWEINGRSLRGHEFHYSQFLGAARAGSGEVYTAREDRVATPVYYDRQILASYMHFYWGEEAENIEEWLEW
jgi:cobyrinic acid a,c-diamide synthase